MAITAGSPEAMHRPLDRKHCRGNIDQPSVRRCFRSSVVGIAHQEHHFALSKRISIAPLAMSSAILFPYKQISLVRSTFLVWYGPGAIISNLPSQQRSKSFPEGLNLSLCATHTSVDYQPHIV